MALGGSGLNGECAGWQRRARDAVVGSQRQTRTSDGGTGYGQSVGPVLFGFGPTATSVDSLIVEGASGVGDDADGCGHGPAADSE